MIYGFIYMDHILYINLHTRPDRKDHVEQQLQQLGYTGTRMEAVECVQGAIGCGQSHIQCLEYAQEQQWPYVCIMEDDITFTNPTLFKSQLRKFLLKIKQWDVLLLGTNMGFPFRKHHGCLRVFNGQTTTGYIVKQHYYSALLDTFKESVRQLQQEYAPSLYAIDIQWKSLQLTGHWYVLFPLTIVQREDYSNIEGKQVNFIPHMLNAFK
jgi:GR25 family glycosyltransferase involved in LPS biosynthesis